MQNHLGRIRTIPTFTTQSLTHGVKVALQILILSVKVRILMGQQKTLSNIRVFLF